MRRKQKPLKPSKKNFPRASKQKINILNDYKNATEKKCCCTILIFKSRPKMNNCREEVMAEQSNVLIF